MERVRASNLLLLITAILLPCCWAAGCDHVGILVDIHNRQVHGRDGIFRYGLAIGLGTPSQNDSLWPAITHNETAFSADDYCATDTTQNCLTGARGFFDIDASSSWQNLSLSTTGGDSNVMYGTAREINGEDTLNLWQTKTYGGPETLVAIDEFPTTILSDYTSPLGLPTFYGPGSTLGLGSASNALNLLVANGNIAARSFGLYLGPGFNGLGDESSGSLVFGGYDAGKFSGPVAVYDQVPALPQHMRSPFKITVDQVSLVTSGGETVIQLANSSFDAYLSTDRAPLQFPQSVTANFQRALGALPGTNQDRTLRLPSAFDGNLTITLSNNITLVFDSSWMTDSLLNTPISAIPLEGGSPLLGSGSTDLVIFGAAFLARAYLFVNYDAKPPNFALAQALPQVTQLDQRPYCGTTIPVAASSTLVHSMSASRKALIGGLCGGLLGGLLILAGIWIFCGSRIRKHLRRNDPRYSATPDSYLTRTPIRMTLSSWKSAIWGNSASDGDYIYKDIGTERRSGESGPPFTFLSYSLEKNNLMQSLSYTGHPVYRLNPPEETLLRSATQDDEKEPGSYADRRRSVSPPRVLPIYLPDDQPLYDSLTKSSLVTMKSPKLISAYNAHVRSGSHGYHSRSGSRNIADVVAAISDSTKLPTIAVDDSHDRQVYDKSLPATPAPSIYAAPSLRVSKTSKSRNRPDGDEPITPAPRIKSFNFTPTNITFKQSMSPVPPMPAIPTSYESTNGPAETNKRHKSNKSAIDQPTSAVTNRSSDSEIKTPATASTMYSTSQWRIALSRSIAPLKNSSSSSSPSSPPVSLESHTSPTAKSTKSNRKVRRPQQESDEQNLHRTQTMSTSASASSRRSRTAMAARLSRLRELQQNGVREIVIRKRARSKPRTTKINNSSQPSSPLAYSSTPAYIALPPSPEPESSEDATSPVTPVHSPQDVRHEPLIRRKALGSSLRNRAVSGVSPCISILGDELLDFGDRPISPISSVGRGRYPGDTTPALPPFPLDFQA